MLLTHVDYIRINWYRFVEFELLRVKIYLYQEQIRPNPAIGTEGPYFRYNVDGLV